MNKQKLIQLLIRVSLLLLFISAVAITAIKYSADIIYMAANPDVFKTILSSYGATAYIGANIQQGNYSVVAIVSVIGCLLLITGFFMKDHIIAFLHSALYKKKDDLAIDPELAK